MPDQAVSDASFYALVNYALAPQQELEVVKDRRANERHDFTSLQFIAPYRDGRLPVESEFEQLLCKDLSPAGLSYVSSEPVTCEYVVVALRTSSLMFLSAAVVRQWPLTLAGEALNLVAVRFISKIHDPNYGPLTAEPPAYAAGILGQL